MATTAVSNVKDVSAQLDHLLVEDALPGELDGFGAAERAAATEFLARLLVERQPDSPRIFIETIPTDSARRRMRLGIVNDDMPFLVDSVAAEIGAHGLAVDRVLHPVIGVRRDAEGSLRALGPRGDGANESLIYMEVERADARVRHKLEMAILALLAQVRHAVADWPQLRARLQADADALGESEGGALLRWFADNKLTLLGFGHFPLEGSPECAGHCARKRICLAIACCPQTRFGAF
jgi:glutamate dehydrogenase